MELKNKLEKCLEQAVENREAAGLSLLIRKGSEDLCFASAGMADLSAGKPVRRDSISLRTDSLHGVPFSGCTASQNR